MNEDTFVLQGLLELSGPCALDGCRRLRGWTGFIGITGGVAQRRGVFADVAAATLALDDAS